MGGCGGVHTSWFLTGSFEVATMEARLGEFVLEMDNMEVYQKL